MNPYAKALDGLLIADPVAAFFEFCQAREAVRLRREAGEPAPWSTDPILQRGRFLNVFREDDRSTRALMRFVGPVADDLPRLVQAVFFARWCNRSETLNALSVELLEQPEVLRERLLELPIQPWCNVTAYPVGPIQVGGQTLSRFDAATRGFDELKNQLVEVICAADRQVTKATQAVNSMFGMDNDFPIFMAVMDIAWFRPEVIDPASPVPTGIGAEPYMERLADHLGLTSHQKVAERMIALQPEYWPDAKRALQPIDVEYLTCECRKYFSYQNGTKAFEGKNVFRPGKTPALAFDVGDHLALAEPVKSGVHVLAGGPCSGKTTLLEALAAAGHSTCLETASALLTGAPDHALESMRSDPVAWQRRILEADLEVFSAMTSTQTVFCDTSFIENLIFGERAGLEFGPNTDAWLRRQRYQFVFFCEPLLDYERTAVRQESRAVALEISRQIAVRYEEFGYELIRLPAAPVEDRIALIEKTLKERRGSTPPR